MRFEYKSQLSELQFRVMNFGNSVLSILNNTVTVVQNNDQNCLKKIRDSEIENNKSEREIENECLKILSLQHPFANDLKIVTGCLRIASDLERIANHCVEICEIISMKNLVLEHKCVKDVVSNLGKVLKMYEQTLEVYSNLNAENAKKICEFDDTIDSEFSTVISSILVSISGKTLNVFAGSDLMFIAKYAERIADHCVNISKWIIYMNGSLI